jgi:hypothetical protein
MIISENINAIIIATMYPRGTRREGIRLGSKEDDWKLNGSSTTSSASTISSTRTRHGGQGRPNLARRQQQFLEVLSSSSESSADSNYTCGTESDVSFVVDPVKPPATRVIVDTAALIESIEKNGKCKQCYWDVEATVRTTCLATYTWLDRQ